MYSAALQRVNALAEKEAENSGNLIYLATRSDKMLILHLSGTERPVERFR